MRMANSLLFPIMNDLDNKLLQCKKLRLLSVLYVRVDKCISGQWLNLNINSVNIFSVQ
jgi:hypothetical protein